MATTAAAAVAAAAAAAAAATARGGARSTACSSARYAEGFGQDEVSQKVPKLAVGPYDRFVSWPASRKRVGQRGDIEASRGANSDENARPVKNDAPLRLMPSDQTAR